MANSKFRVIIAGGGPVGLTTAHALTKAGIDFVLLERRPSVVEDVGASLVITPESLRALAQLGLLDRLRRIGVEFKSTTITTLDGVQYNESTTMSLMKDNNGTLSYLLHRAHLVEALYDELDDKAKLKVFANKKVTKVTSDSNGVTVRCADGSSYDGSMVIGADGAHSCVRKSMRTLALEESPTAEVNLEQPWQYEYRLMWLTCPSRPEVAKGTSIDAHGTDCAAQFLNGDTRAWLLVYERIAEPTTGRSFYTPQDVEAYAERFGDLAITPTFNVRDAFAARFRAGMVNMEEGVLPHWHWGRLVLAGDAAHKVTPNAGRGLNGGIQDAVALANELGRLLASEGRAAPSREALGSAFARYQDLRLRMFRPDFDYSTQAIRLSAWKTYTLWLVDRWLWPLVPTWLEAATFGRLLCGRISQGLAFDFVKGDEPFVGKLPWANTILKG